jgi:tetratricopeptide (TPR) repeat protein
MRLLLVLSLLLGTLAAAHATEEDRSAAKRLFLSGSKHFDLGEYEQALGDFKEAYRLHEDPTLLYNIAQCHRLLRHNEEALRAYKTFLARSPDSPVRPDVERRINELDEAISAQKSAPTTPAERKPIEPAPAAPPPATTAATSPTGLTATAPPRHKPVYKQWWLWTAVGAAVLVGVGVGVGVGLANSGSKSTTFPPVTF